MELKRQKRPKRVTDDAYTFYDIIGDMEVLNTNRTYIEEKAREHLGRWFVSLRMNPNASVLTLTALKGASVHAPDFNGFRQWITTHDF
ncbi:MAG: hypothetical protein RLZZ360_519 [Candidatus Parcubacteria bacterium]